MKRLLLIVMIATDLAACSCLVTDAKSSFKGSAAVFTGEVVSYDGRLATMRVIEAFKGVDRAANVEFVSGEDGAACGYGSALVPGSRHLIYAYRETGGWLAVSLCSRSGLEQHATCDLRFLRSRAWWWRSPLSSPRILRRLGVTREPCPVP